ncbi:MAG: hypothetical protein PUC65_00170 [Clostridiales bacterium]|nr:hypothetical protein [Clostridiales bacterium]
MDNQNSDESYRKMRNWILCGIVFTSFHITLGSIVIFPEFIGLWMVTYGISQLENKIGCQELKKAKLIFFLYGILSAFGFVSDKIKLLGPTLIIIMIQSLSMVLEIIGFFELFQGLIATNLCNKKETVQKYLSCYLVLSFITIGTILVAIYAIFQPNLALIMIFLIFALRASVMYQLCSNCFHNN